MKSKYCLSFLLLLGYSAFAQSNIYYGDDMLTVIREEREIQKCNIIQLAGSINIRECDNAKTIYTVSDHLGSTRLVLDASLANNVSCDYDAYGHISLDVPESLREQCRYTQTYRWNNATQLYQSPTRIYQSVAKRFLSLDPKKQGYSGYQYAFSNSIRYTDVSGAINVDEVMEKIWRMPVFKELRKFPSGSRLYVPHLLAYEKNMSLMGEEEDLKLIGELNTKVFRLHKDLDDKVNEIMKAKALNRRDASTSFFRSGEYKKMVYETGVANCGECAKVMLKELHDAFPHLNSEMLAHHLDPEITAKFDENQANMLWRLDHVFNVLNRDPSTPFNDPSLWNKDAIVVDAWKGRVFSARNYAIMTQYPEHIYNIQWVHPRARLILGPSIPPEQTRSSSLPDELLGAVGGLGISGEIETEHIPTFSEHIYL